MSTVIQESIRHFQNESDLWMRLLEFICQENNYLKNQLADIVCQDINNEMLCKAEEFQNRFIEEEEMIALVQKDIHKFNDWLFCLLAQNEMDNDKYRLMRKKLRNEIEQLEQHFNNLKFEFLNYVAEKI